jgi:hypothetical protein
MAKEKTTDQRKQRGKLLEDVVFPLPETIVKMPKEMTFTWICYFTI